jgi:AraC family transcriptional regulator of adaptative response/methylated-DNA-[protein]-cysteine methyltransferase
MPSHALMPRPTAAPMPPIDETAAWDAVLRRDAAWDGRLVYAVATTGVYCRPSCPSRHALRKNVRFYPSAAAAVVAGFRACKRCRPDGTTHAESCVAEARRLLDAHVASGGDRPTLDRLAVAVGMSAFHLQRVFKAHVGATPAEYVRVRRGERFKAELRGGETVSRATYGAGYGSSSRAYADAAALLGMTPARYRRGGRGMTIRYVVVPCALGVALVAGTERGLCAVSLGDDAATLERALRAEYPEAAIEPAGAAGETSGDGDPLAAWVAEVVAYLDARGVAPTAPVDVDGTPFQRRVWDALRAIPAGETRSYAEVAEAIGAPRAARAVAAACAHNRVALVIPCHRVVRRGGEGGGAGVGGYRWGPERKRRLLEQERGAR